MDHGGRSRRAGDNTRAEFRKPRGLSPGRKMFAADPKGLPIGEGGARRACEVGGPKRERANRRNVCRLLTSPLHYQLGRSFRLQMVMFRTRPERTDLKKIFHKEICQRLLDTYVHALPEKNSCHLTASLV